MSKLLAIRPKDPYQARLYDSLKRDVETLEKATKAKSTATEKNQKIQIIKDAKKSKLISISEADDLIDLVMKKPHIDISLEIEKISKNKKPVKKYESDSSSSDSEDEKPKKKTTKKKVVDSSDSSSSESEDDKKKKITKKKGKGIESDILDYLKQF